MLQSDISILSLRVEIKMVCCWETAVIKDPENTPLILLMTDNIRSSYVGCSNFFIGFLVFVWYPVIMITIILEYYNVIVSDYQHLHATITTHRPGNHWSTPPSHTSAMPISWWDHPLQNPMLFYMHCAMHRPYDINLFLAISNSVLTMPLANDWSKKGRWHIL